MLPSGVFRLDFSFDRSSYLQDVVDANGKTTTIVTSSGHEHDADITVAYGLGPVELGARIVFQLAQLGASVDLGSGLGVVTALFQYYMSTSTRPYDYAQVVGYHNKLIAIPKRLSFNGAVSARLSEISLTPEGMPPASGTTFSISAGASATVQIVRRVSFTAGASVGKVISYSPGLVYNDGAALSLYSLVEVTFHRWDLYAQGGFDDLTRTKLPFAAAGFVHRWF